MRCTLKTANRTLRLAKVLIKLIQHILSALAGKGIEFFIPRWFKESKRKLLRGEEITQTKLDSVDDMPMLRFVTFWHYGDRTPLKNDTE